MKKMLVFFMIAVMAIASFSGCGGKNQVAHEDQALTMPQPGVADSNNSSDNNQQPSTDNSQSEISDKNESPEVDPEINHKDETDNSQSAEKAEQPQPDNDNKQAPDTQEPANIVVTEPANSTTEENPPSETQQPSTSEPLPDANEGSQTSPAQNTDGLTTIQRQKPINKPATYTGDKYLLLVNPWNYLPEDFTRNTKKIEGHYIDVGAYDDIVLMLADMRKEGLKPYICSSTRTIDYQKGLFDKRLAKNKASGLSEQEALDETAKWTAIPGTSEHHTGYALDIVSTYNTTLDESQENTPEQQWMMKNSWKYGFILRYPNGKTDITGIYYEPWHYRYVGKKAAKEIYESGLTLEEYLEKELHQ